MLVIKRVILLGVLLVGGTAVASGVMSLAERHKVLTEGLAEAIATKYTGMKGIEELGKLIFQQKQRFIMLVDKNFYEFMLESYVAQLRTSKEELTRLREKALGELTVEEARRSLIEDGKDSEVATVLGDVFDTYSDSGC